MRTLSTAVLGLLVAASGCTSSAPQTAKTTTTATVDAAVGNASAPDDDESQAPQAAVAEPETTTTDHNASAPIVRQAAKPVVGDGESGIPPVLLSAGHAKLCRVNVGDVIPTIELPKLGGGPTSLDSLAGQRATVVLFWTNDHWMSAMALRDVARVAAPEGVAVVGIAVDVPADAAQKRLADAGAKFPQLVDTEGTALAQVGELALPRIYVLDAQRQVAWFDIEYSEATYRELLQTLAALTGDRATN